jgi:mannosyltransferase OCH1-like enzyme
MIIPYVEHFPKLNQLWNLIPHWVVKADIARYLIVYFDSGYYFDVDCEIRRPIQIHQRKNTILFIEKIIKDLHKLGPREHKSETHKIRIANYAFGTRETKDPFLRDVIEECIKRLIAYLMEKNQGINERDIVWLAGPDVVTSVYHRTSDKSRLQLMDPDYLEHHEYGSWRNKQKK